MTTYGSEVIGYSAEGVGHTVPVHETIDLAFFGITGGGPSSTSSAPPPPPSSSIAAPPVSSSPSNGAVAQHWDQCGGIGFTGPTVCAAPFVCTVSNGAYSFFDLERYICLCYMSLAFQPTTLSVCKSTRLVIGHGI